MTFIHKQVYGLKQQTKYLPRKPQGIKFKSLAAKVELSFYPRNLSWSKRRTEKWALENFG